MGDRHRIFINFRDDFETHLGSFQVPKLRIVFVWGARFLSFLERKSGPLRFVEAGPFRSEDHLFASVGLVMILESTVCGFRRQFPRFVFAFLFAQAPARTPYEFSSILQQHGIKHSKQVRPTFSNDMPTSFLLAH